MKFLISMFVLGFTNLKKPAYHTHRSSFMHQTINFTSKLFTLFDRGMRGLFWYYSTPSTKPLLWEQRSSRGYTLTVVCFAVFTDVFCYGVIVPVLPFSLPERVGTPNSDMQRWISVLLATYGAALIVASPICGWVADKSSSRRLPLLCGLVALAGSMTMLCAGTSIAVLVAGRILQGFSSAFVWVVGMAILVDAVGHADLGRDVGYVSTMSAVAVMTGPLLGGLVYARAGYDAVFAMSFALLGVDILLRLFLIEKKSAQRWAPSAAPTVITTDALTSMNLVEKCNVVQVVQDQDPSCQEPPEKQSTVVMETSGPDTNDTNRSSPAIFQLLRSRRLLAALWAILVIGILQTSFDTVLPLYVHQIFDWHSSGAGLLFMALLGPSFAGPLVGHVTDRCGAKYPVAAGFLLLLPCLILLRLVTHHSIQQIVLLCSLLVLVGVALALSLTPLMAEIAYVVEAEERATPGIYGKKGAYAQAYGLFSVMWSAGTIVGPLWSGYVREKAGWGTMAWSLGALAAAGAVPTLLWTGGSMSLLSARRKQGEGVV